MPPTITDDDDNDAIQATANILVTGVAHIKAVADAIEIAVKSCDLETIRNVRRVLDLMTKTLEGRQPPMPTPRAHKFES